MSKYSNKQLKYGAIFLVFISLFFLVPQVCIRLFLGFVRLITLDLITFKYTNRYYYKQIKEALQDYKKAENDFEKAVALDSLAGSIAYGSKHTISAIVGYKAFQNSKIYMYIEYFIDWLFYTGHCIESAYDENLINENLTQGLTKNV